MARLSVHSVTHLQGLRRLGIFLCSIALLAGLASWILRFWIDLSWWRIFRRCVSLAAALALLAFARRDRDSSFRSLGLGDFQRGRGQFGAGLAIGFGVVLAIVAGYLALGVCRISVYPDTARVIRVVLTFLPIAGLVALLEELVFRGFVMRQLMIFSSWGATFLSSLAFALVHLRTHLVWPGTMLEVIGLFLLGVVLSLSYFRTGQRLYLAIGLHAGLAYCSRVIKLLFEFTEPSLAWLVGTSRLVNGLVGWAVLVGMGAWLVWWGPRWGREHT